MSLSDTVYSNITHSDNWGTMGLKKTSLDAAVLTISFASYLNEENAGEEGLTPTNHWSIFLKIEENQSVRIDAVPNSPGEPAMIIVDTLICAMTDDVVHVVAATTTTRTTVAEILNLIIAKRRHNYVFSPVGEGCRFWLYTLAQDLSEAKIISQDDANAARHDLQHYWPSPVGTVSQHRAFNKGTFLDSA